MIAVAVRALEGVLVGLAAWTGSVIAAWAGSDPPIIVAVGAGSALIVVLVLRRIVGSMIASSQETIDGLRAENERLRSLLADRDNKE